MGDEVKAASVGPFRFEPTVFSAVRRHRILVLVVALLALAAAVGYSLMQPQTYRTLASVTVPQQVSLQGQDTAQYLDSQVVLLQSEAVARRAAAIANGELRSNRLTTRDFRGDDSSLEITPPAGASPSVYGASIIDLSFSGPSARIAQVGANAVLQAFDEVRSATISAQGDATVAGIDRAINDSTSQNQRSDLTTQRTQVLVEEQIDLAHHPAVVAQPATRVSASWKRNGAIGLLIGIVVGAALAYALAIRRRSFEDRKDPAALYGVPLIGEIPAFEAEKTSRSNGSQAHGLLPMTADPHSAVAEAFRFAAGSIERVRAVRGPRLSLVFVSPMAGGGKSTVVANLALAIAEGGTRVLVVDADTANGDLTRRLLPGARTVGGFEHVLAGHRPLTGCIQTSPVNGAVAVLGSGPAPSHVTGAARSKAVGMLLAEAKSSFDIVLIDSPALLQVADATELVGASDAAITVLSPNELIRDHLEMVDRLNLIGSDVVGYIYNRVPMRPHLGRYRRNGYSAAPLPPVLVPARPLDGESHPSSQPSAQG